jgi:hypothetical protein
MYNFEKMSKTWHYDRKVISQDELRKIGSTNVSQDDMTTVNKMLNNPLQGGIKRIHSGNPVLQVGNQSVSERSKYMRKIGYNENQYFIEFNHHCFDNIVKNLKNNYNVSYDHSCVVIVPPGQCMPAHGDTYGYLQRYMKRDNPDVYFDLAKHARRYVVFLSEWSWGQSFGAGNTIKCQWLIGDVYEWDHRLIHWCSNSGLDPLIFFEISGLEL